MRAAEMPAVPIFPESGLPDVILTSRIGIFGLSGMSPATASQLSAAILASASFATAWRLEITRFRDVVRDAKVPVV